jgi:hypothetical protein
MTILAIDPGSSLSALVWYDPGTNSVLKKIKIENEAALDILRDDCYASHLAIELAESFGAKVWQQVFTTTVWVGRFVQEWSRSRGSGTFTYVKRREVKMELTGSARAKDGQIRNVLLERWGGKVKAIGTKKDPGPLHGVTADCWQALAVGVTYATKAGLL